MNERINAAWPAYEAALKDNKVDYQHFVYAGMEHGFNNDTTPRYDEAAARLAWSRTLDFGSGQGDFARMYGVQQWEPYRRHSNTDAFDIAETEAMASENLDEGREPRMTSGHLLREPTNRSQVGEI